MVNFSLGSSPLGGSSLGYSALGRSALGGSSLGSSALGGSAFTHMPRPLTLQFIHSDFLLLMELKSSHLLPAVTS